MVFKDISERLDDMIFWNVLDEIPPALQKETFSHWNGGGPANEWRVFEISVWYHLNTFKTILQI